jgi:hypothetical protein
MKRLEILEIVIVLSLVGIIVFQQYQISGLFGQNRELALSNQQKDNNCDELTNQYNQLQRDSQNAYSQLNASYRQLLSNLGQVIETLERKDANFTSLSESYDVQLLNYDSLLQKYNDLKNVAVQLCDNYGATDGIFILDYKYSWGSVGMTATYLANMTLYNALLTANVTVKVYGLKGTTKTFTYTIPSGTILNKVEGWSGGVFVEDYDYIMIESVERNW